MGSALKAGLPALPKFSPLPQHYQKELLKFISSHTSLLFKVVQWLPTAFGVKYFSVECKGLLHLTPAFLPFSFNSHHSPTNSLRNKLSLPETIALNLPSVLLPEMLFLHFST